MDSGLTPEILQKLKEAVRAKLTELDKYVDDELPDYVIVLVSNRKSRERMTKDLKLFLGNEAGSFTNWLYETVEKITSLVKVSKPGNNKKRKHKSPSAERSPKRSRARGKKERPEKGKLSSCVVVKNISSDEEDVKLSSIVKVKERPKSSSRNAPSGRLLMKAVHEAQKSPDNKAKSKPRKRDDECSDTEHLQSEEEGEDLKIQLDDDEEAEIEDRAAEEPKFIVTLEGVKKKKSRSDIKSRIGHLNRPKTSESPAEVEKAAVEPKLKPSLAVEPVVSAPKALEDKKLLRAQRFQDVKKSPIPAPVVDPSPTSSVIAAFNATAATTRCKFWPKCKLGTSCVFFHPPIPAVVAPKPPVMVAAPAVPMCVNFPNCPFGDSCRFGHPPCKFGDACMNAACVFSHVKSRAKKPCYYGLGCRNPACPFLHPFY